MVQTRDKTWNQMLGCYSVSQSNASSEKYDSNSVVIDLHDVFDSQGAVVYRLSCFDALL